MGLLGLPFYLAACGGGGSGSDEPSEDQSLSQDTAFAYVERSIATSAAEGLSHFQSKLQNQSEAPQDLNSPYAFQPGAKLVHRSSLDVDAVQWSVLDSYFGSANFDVKDLNVSKDGSRVVFAAHGPANHPSHYTWNIYEYQFESRSVRRIIADDAIANSGRDTNPTYAHDGRIVFSSDREAGNPNSPVDNIVDNEQAENCYKVGPSESPSLLHIMSAQGENIVQLTYGNNHDTTTTTLTDGKVAFVRWSRSYDLLPQCDDVSSGGVAYDDIFSVNSNYPSGLSKPQAWTDLQLCNFAIPTPLGKALASNHYTLLRISPETEQLEQLYETVTQFGSDEEFVFLNDLVQGRDGYLLSVMKHFYNQHQGGNLVSLQDPSNATDDKVFGKVAPQSLVSNNISLYPNQKSLDGWFSAVAPYRDGSSRLLMSWSQCSTVNNGVNAFCNQGQDGEVSSQYGIWVYDPATNSRLPIVQSRRDVVYTELAVAQAQTGRDLPFAPVNANFVDNLDAARIICDDPSVPPVNPPPVDPPIDPPPVDPPIDPPPVDPPIDPPPVDPPIDPPPVDPPIDPPPVDPPIDPPPVDPPTEPNAAPVANAGTDQNAFVGETVNFDGSASSDPDRQPQPLTYQWHFAVLPVESALGDNNISDASSATPSFVPDVRGEFELELKVSDGDKFDTDTVTVNLGNNSPVADAGANQNVAGGMSVELDGSASFDPDGDRISYLWSFLEKPPTSTLSDANILGRTTPNPIFTPDTAVVLPIKADFVFIIDGSHSMDEEIAVVREGLQAFVEQLSDPANDIDARFAVVTFEERPIGSVTPVVKLGFTASTTIADVADDVIAAFDAIDTSSLGGQQREAGLEAIRMVLGEPSAMTGLEFRADARKNLILATDEDSDGPYNGGNYEAPKNSDITDTQWQDEVDETAALVIANNAFIDMLVEPDNGASTQQYGVPAADRTEVDSNRFDPQATLAALEDPAIDEPNSLQAQVLRAGLIARTYEVTSANDPIFVDSFFNSKVASTGENPLLGYYVLSLVVNDGDSSSVVDTVSVQAFAGNAPPNARAGADQNALVSNLVELDASQSNDSDGPNAMSFVWEFVEVPSGSALTNANIANANSVNASFTPDVAGNYIVELTVADGGPGSSGYDEDRIVISVSSTATGPNANAGVNQSVANCNAVLLNGSASLDPDGGPQAISFAWTLVSRPNNSALMSLDIDSGDTANASFTPDRLGSFVFELKVHDGENTDTDNVMVTVGDANQSGNACP
jgi:hypothetical protein